MVESRMEEYNESAIRDPVRHHNVLCLRVFVGVLVPVLASDKKGRTKEGSNERGKNERLSCFCLIEPVFFIFANG